jgi:hypothetical protein
MVDVPGNIGLPLKISPIKQPNPQISIALV